METISNAKRLYLPRAQLCSNKSRRYVRGIILYSTLDVVCFFHNLFNYGVMWLFVWIWMFWLHYKFTGLTCFTEVPWAHDEHTTSGSSKCWKYEMAFLSVNMCQGTSAIIDIVWVTWCNIVGTCGPTTERRIPRVRDCHSVATTSPLRHRAAAIGGWRLARRQKSWARKCFYKTWAGV